MGHPVRLLRSVCLSLTPVFVVRNAYAGCACSIMSGHRCPIRTVKCSPWYAPFSRRAGVRALTQTLTVLRSGKYIASAGDDMAVLVWEIATGRVCRLFRGHKQAVHSVDFSACGRFLSSASADGKSPAVIDRSIDGFDSSRLLCALCRYHQAVVCRHIAARAHGDRTALALAQACEQPR